MNISELPLELIDEILKRLDAISLAKSRQVCRSWRALHSQPRYKLLWKQACFRDIDKDVLTELTGSRYIASAEEDPGGLSGTSDNIQGENNDINWEAIYQKWFRSRHIGRWPSMITELKGHRGVQEFYFLHHSYWKVPLYLGSVNWADLVFEISPYRYFLYTLCSYEETGSY